MTWPYTMTTPYWLDFEPNSTFYRILTGFHRTFATGVACRQGTLTPPDTWSCPIWDLQMFFCWDHWHSIIHCTSFWHLSLTWTFYRIWRYYWIKVSIGHLQRVWHADRVRLLLRTPGPVPLELAYVLLVETNPFPNLSLFSGLCSSNSPRYFLDFA